MAKPLRIEFDGATYHVMARGNQGQKICLDDHDREMWLVTQAVSRMRKRPGKLKEVNDPPRMSSF